MWEASHAGMGRDGKERGCRQGSDLYSGLGQPQMLISTNKGSKDTVSIKDVNQSPHIHFNFYVSLCSAKRPGTNRTVFKKSMHLLVIRLFRSGPRG